MVYGKGILDQELSLFIESTTPESIPANTGMSVNPRFDTVQVQVCEHKYVVSAECLYRVAVEVGWEQPKILKTFKGTVMDKKSAKHPC